MSRKPVAVPTGTKKKTFRSIKEAAEASGIPYMTLYMRVRKLGWKGATAVKRKPRKYTRKPRLLIAYQPELGCQ